MNVIKQMKNLQRISSFTSDFKSKLEKKAVEINRNNEVANQKAKKERTKSLSIPVQNESEKQTEDQSEFFDDIVQTNIPKTRN